MKTLFLLRHGKSDWGADNDSDHERPLAKRGMGAARLIGSYLARANEVPDFALSSSAVRAKDSLRLAMEAGAWACPVEETPDLYDTTPSGALKVIRGLDDSWSSVLLAGHEPTSSGVTAGLIGGGEVRFPTAALVRIDLPVTQWRQVRWGLGTLIWFVNPRLLEKVVSPVSSVSSVKDTGGSELQ